jgi:short-subunit dehydrogenase
MGGMADKPLAGKAALVAGSSKGLGRAMVIALGDVGSSITPVSRDLDTLNDGAECIGAGGDWTVQ